MEKKWYQSKKLAAAVIGAVLVFLNDYFMLGLPKEEITSAIKDGQDFMTSGMVVAYILLEFILDMKRQKDSTAEKQKGTAPIQDPMIREALESLIYQYYDFSMAQEIGVDLHAKGVTENVLGSLADLIGDVVLDDQDLRAEILRQIFKFYNKDVSMKEGADLVYNAKVSNI